ncbi:ABC transporter permease [uncultured Martelella sp.]|uniref:ABC transporter permease n=1 Tax=uncultured Martelella sp. TaxID=392331 RepID=UPI0029C75F60|nr:ABC transporter permease [uncultured Martelella sp.]
MSTPYLIKRLLLIVYTLFIVSLIVFAMTQVLPGDAAVMMLGQNATDAALAALRTQMHLNDPLWMQYLRWVGNVVRGDFGISLRTSQPVGPAMMQALGRSLLLALLSISLMLVIAVPLGILAAVRRGRIADLVVSLVSYLGVSLPEFVTATLAITLFADYMKWLPPTGYVPLTENFWGGLQHLILPVCVISVVMIAHVSRMIRSELVDVLHSDYIRAATLKGLPRRTVLFGHAVRNSLLPAITVVALDVGYLLGGVIVVEEIFAIPGIGRALIVAIQARDLPAIQAGTLIMAATYCIVNFIADLLYAVLDKRIQYD